MKYEVRATVDGRDGSISGPVFEDWRSASEEALRQNADGKEEGRDMVHYVVPLPEDELEERKRRAEQAYRELKECGEA